MPVNDDGNDEDESNSYFV